MMRPAARDIARLDLDIFNHFQLANQPKADTLKLFCSGVQFRNKTLKRLVKAVHIIGA